MRRIAISLSIAALAILTVVAAVSAASPAPTPAQDQVRTRDTLPVLLGLTQAEIMELRHDGLTLAQIAERQKVDPQKLIDAIAAQWTARIDARVANGGRTAAEATTLKSQVALRARAMVYQAPTGGMRGAAVGAGPGTIGGGGMGMHQGARNGSGAGDGTCDGTGPHGPAGR